MSGRKIIVIYSFIFYVAIYRVILNNRLKTQRHTTNKSIQLPGRKIKLSFRLRFDHQIFSFPRIWHFHLTRCVLGLYWCTCQMASEFVEPFKQGAQMWQTDDKQPDHATEKCVVINETVCAERAFRLKILQHNRLHADIFFSKSLKANKELQLCFWNFYYKF